MKTCLPITILLALVLAISASAAQVGSVRLAYENGATVARIDVQGPFQFRHTSEVPKDGKPDRLIVDIIGATHTWGPKEWSSLPATCITKLRIGQYSSKPEQVVRVVLELSKAPVYQADSDGKVITIRLTDASTKAFAAWSTGPAPTTAPVVPTTAVAPATTPKPAAPAPATTPAVASAPKVENKAAAPTSSHTTLAQQQPTTAKPAPSTPATKPTSTPTTTPTTAAAPVTKPAPAVASNDNKQTPSTQTAPASKPTPAAPKVESKPAPTVAANTPTVAPSSTPTTKPSPAAPKVETKPSPAVATAPVSPAVSTPKVETKPAPTVASAPVKPAATTTQAPVTKPADVAPKVESKPTVAAQTPVQPASTPVAKPAVTTGTQPAAPVVAQATPKVEPKAEVKVAPQDVKPVVPATSAKPEQLAKAEQFKGPLPSTPSSSATEKNSPVQTPEVKPASPAVASTQGSAVEQKPVDSKPADESPAKPVAPADVKASAPQSPLLAEADDATGISTPARQTARFRRSATASARMKSSLVAEFPQRLVIKYENMGYRDPFATLIDDSRTYDTPIEKRLANVEGLRLVGILENASGDNRALFQDKRNFSYMLKAGDKVEKGYVLRVEADKVYFQIFEYGWSRTVALTFDNRE